MKKIIAFAGIAGLSLSSWVHAQDDVVASSRPFVGPLGPSAQVAANLEKSAPPNYIGHYLPQDRYKLGSVWAYVTTENDHYYHLPSCPRMLQRSPDNVIGFTLTREAEEAGYKADSGCAGGFGGGGGGFNPGRGLGFAQTGTFKLADGRMTVKVPAGVKRVSTQQMNFGKFAFAVDTFSTSGGRITITSIQSDEIKAQDVTKSMNQLKSMFGNMNSFTGGTINNQFQPKADVVKRMFDGMVVRKKAFGGLDALVMANPQPGSPREPRRVFIASSGNRVYSLTDFTRSGKVADQLLARISGAN